MPASLERFPFTESLGNRTEEESDRLDYLRQIAGLGPTSRFLRANVSRTADRRILPSKSSCRDSAHTSKKSLIACNRESWEPAYPGSSDIPSSRDPAPRRRRSPRQFACALRLSRDALETVHAHLRTLPPPRSVGHAAQKVDVLGRTRKRSSPHRQHERPLQDEFFAMRR